MNTRVGKGNVSGRASRAPRLARRATLVLAALPALPALGAVRAWSTTQPAGTWSAPESWTAGAPPVANDSVLLDTAGADVDAVYDLAGSPRFASVAMQTGTAAGRFTLRLDDPAGRIVSDGFTVGASGAARVVHAGGTNQVDGTLDLGLLDGAVGVYELAGGRLNAQYVNVGSFGVGTFVHTGGRHAVTGSLAIGSGDAATPSAYTLGPGAVLNVAGDTIVGNFGAGVFTHSGGTHTASRLAVGRDFARGTYNFQSGNLQVADLVIGGGGHGTFVHDGGTLTLTSPDGAMVVGADPRFNATYTMSNGATIGGVGQLHVGRDGNGTFNQRGGTVTVADEGPAFYPFSVGAGPRGRGVYNLSAGTLSVDGVSIIDRFGQFNQTGGVHNVDGYISVIGSTSGAGYNMSGGVLNANVNVYAPGGFHHSGGTVNADYIELFSGTYAMSNGASLDVNSLTVGQNNGARFDLTGGDAAVGTLRLSTWGASEVRQSGGSLTVASHAFVALYNAGSEGTYRLSGGELRVTGQTQIGLAGKGTFVQDGGTFTAGQILFVGFSGSNNAYVLNGGSLVANQGLLLGYNPSSRGTYAQTGGTATIDGIDLYRGNSTLNLSGGTLTARYLNLNAFGGTAVVNHTGGLLRVGTNALQVGISTNGAATYNLGPGAELVVDSSVMVGASGRATFNQTGGTVTLIGPNAYLYLSEKRTGRGVYNLSDGSLVVGKAAFIGSSADATFNQSGGSVTVEDTLFLANATGTQAAYNLSGGSVTADVMELGVFGSGTFNQTNGAVIATELNLGSYFAQVPARGAYNLHGGSLQTEIARVGFGGDGTFKQSGGAFTANTGVLIGFADYSGSQASSFELTGGTVSTPLVNVGYSAAARAVLTVNGGSATVSTALVAGVEGTTTGTVNVLTGRLNAAEIYLGRTNTAHGVLNQSGGYAFGSRIYLSSNDAAATGAVNLTGGTLESNNTYVGVKGRGVFNHSAGVHNIYGLVAGNGLVIGDGPQSHGTYALSGTGSLRSTVEFYVGNEGRAEYVQTGGTASTLRLVLANAASSSATASLSAGSLAVTTDEHVGRAGDALFTQTGGAHTVGGRLVVGSDTTGSGAFRLQGGSLNAPNIAVHRTGTFTHSGGTLTARAVTLAGGTMTVGNVDWLDTPSIDATGGALTLDADSGSDAPHNRRLRIDLADTAATFNTTQHLSSLRLRAGASASMTGAGVLVANSLAVEGDAKLDIARGGIVLNLDPTAPLFDPRTLLRSAYAGGAWTGPGLTSSAARAEPAYAIGYARAGEILDFTGTAPPTFLSEAVHRDDDLLVRLTLFGDATLDGAVDFTDLVKLAQNYGDDSVEATWVNGDFTYDGVVDFQDLVKLAQNYGGSLPAGAIAGAPASFSHDLAAAFASVPEPAALSALLLPAFGFAARRRRSST